MPQSFQIGVDGKDYPFPWCMPEPPQQQPADWQSPSRAALEDPHRDFCKWLGEFSDATTGGTSPPPLH